jgi:hypothetical protein
MDRKRIADLMLPRLASLRMGGRVGRIASVLGRGPADGPGPQDLVMQADNVVRTTILKTLPGVYRNPHAYRRERTGSTKTAP